MSGGAPAVPGPRGLAFKFGGGSKKKLGGRGGRPTVAAAFLRAEAEADATAAEEAATTQLAAGRLLEEGTGLAEEGDLHGALRKWDQAAALNPVRRKRKRNQRDDM